MDGYWGSLFTIKTLAGFLALTSFIGFFGWYWEREMRILWQESVNIILETMDEKKQDEVLNLIESKLKDGSFGE